MKKWIALLIAAVLLLSLAACGELQSSINNFADQVGQEVNQEISRGVINGNLYTSDFSGLSFTKPQEWLYASDEEIAQTMDMSMDVLSDLSAYQEAVAKLSSVYDMMVSDPNTGSNISVMYENLSLTGGEGMSEERYLQILESQVDSFEDMTYVFEDETYKVTLSGESYVRVHAVVDYNGTQMDQYYYVRNLGKYMNAVIVTLLNGTSIEAVEAMFSRTM